MKPPTVGFDQGRFHVVGCPALGGSGACMCVVLPGPSMAVPQRPDVFADGCMRPDHSCRVRRGSRRVT